MVRFAQEVNFPQPLASTGVTFLFGELIHLLAINIIMEQSFGN